MHGRGACVAGGPCMVGVYMAGGVRVARGACMVGRHAWQGACMAGVACVAGYCMAGGACIPGGMHGMHTPPADTMRYGQ